MNPRRCQLSRRCQLCGDARRELDEDGVCTYRPGCDHRVMVADAIVARLMVPAQWTSRTVVVPLWAWDLLS